MWRRENRGILRSAGPCVPGVRMSGAGDEVLTLEPLLEAVRTGIESVGWTLSGLQKTTSHHFEGRWAGDSTRSAYLFFHRPEGPDWCSLDVYLDETSRGLTGDLALVVDGAALGAIGDVRGALVTLGELSAAALPEGYARPVTLRLRLSGPGSAPEEADTEIRLKLRIPRAAFSTGRRTLEALASSTAAAFHRMLTAPGLSAFLD